MATCRFEIINQGNAVVPRSCAICGIGRCTKGLPDPYKKKDPAHEKIETGRLRKVRKLVENLPKHEVGDDLFALFEQLGTAEYAQDQELIRKLRAKYDWDW